MIVESLEASPIQASHSLPLHSFIELSSHARVHLHHSSLFCLFKDPHCQISCARPNLENYVGSLEIGFIDDTLGHQGIFEDMLPESVRVEDRILGGSG